MTRIHTEHIIQSVATARDPQLAANLFNNLGITELRHIYGCNAADTHKTNILNNLIALYPEIPRENCLFISDSPSDIITGKELGIPTVGVGYGFSDLEHIKNAEPKFIAETVDDLNKLLMRLILKKQTIFSVTETLEMTVEIEAANADDAIEIAEKNWKNSDYILDADHFTGVEFEVVDI